MIFRSVTVLFLAMMAIPLSLSAQTVINHNYIMEQGNGRTVGSMNKCIKEGESPLYTDGVCPSGYTLEDEQWQSEANFSYKEDTETRLARELAEQKIEQERQEAAAGKEMKEGDLEKEFLAVSSVMTLMGADESDRDSSKMDEILQRTAKQFLPKDADVSNVKFKDAFEYGIKALFSPDSIVNEALGVEE